MKVGDKAKVSPQLTGESDWVEGEVIDIEQRDEIRLDRIFLSLMDQRKRRLFHAQMDVICAIVRVSLHAIGHGAHRTGIDDLAAIWVINIDDR